MTEEKGMILGTGIDEGECPDSGAVVINDLSELGDDALINEAWLARTFRITTRTVRRMVERGELPPPLQLAGRPWWRAGGLRSYLKGRDEQGARDALGRVQKILNMGG